MLKFYLLIPHPFILLLLLLFCFYVKCVLFFLLTTKEEEELQSAILHDSSTFHINAETELLYEYCRLVCNVGNVSLHHAFRLPSRLLLSLSRVNASQCHLPSSELDIYNGLLLLLLPLTFAYCVRVSCPTSYVHNYTHNNIIIASA